MKYSFFIFFFVLVGRLGFTHDANKAFFTITEVSTDLIEVEMEVPWSFRNAVFEAYPEIKESKDIIAYRKAMEDYVKERFLLIGENNVPFSFESMEELEHDGHSHQANFRIMYKGNKLYKISNTFMFNLYKKQRNFHYLKLNNEDQTFETNTSNPEFWIGKTKETNGFSSFLKGIIAGTIAGLILLFVLKLKSNK